MLVAGAAAFTARSLADVIDVPRAHTDQAVDFVTRLSLVRAMTWAVAGTTLAIWLAARTRRTDLFRLGMYGLLVGAVGGGVGGAIWALPVELADVGPKSDLANWIEMASLAVTGGFLGALIGTLRLPPRLWAGLAGGLVAGVLIQLILIGVDTKIAQPLKFGIVGIAIAGLTLALLALGGRQSRAELPPYVGVADP